MGRDDLDCRKDRLYGRDAAALVRDEKTRIKLLEREVKELRRANEILRKASAYFAMAEFDRRER